jgi:hypothetical protein
VLRALCSIAAALLAIAAASPALDGPPLAATVQPVPLDPTHPDAASLGRLRYMGGLWLEAGDPRFGGFSDLRIGDGGRSLVAVSDCGTSLTAALQYDGEGRLRAADRLQLRPLAAPGGRTLSRAEVDAESLVRLRDGSYVVGFEGQHRLWRYPAGEPPLVSSPVPVAGPAEAASLPSNEGFEALVALPDGRLLVLAESVRGSADRTAGWVQSGGSWSAFELPLLVEDDAPRDPFRPTGAALLPSGDVVLVERRWPALAARLRLITSKEVEARSSLAGAEIARLAPPFTLDNYEGIEAAPGPDGRLRVFLLSDDNDCSKGGPRAGANVQRTLLLSFVLAD